MGSQELGFVDFEAGVLDPGAGVLDGSVGIVDPEDCFCGGTITLLDVCFFSHDTVVPERLGVMIFGR